MSDKRLVLRQYANTMRLKWAAFLLLVPRKQRLRVEVPMLVFAPLLDAKS
jgi:hypothetical protein